MRPSALHGVTDCNGRCSNVVDRTEIVLLLESSRLVEFKNTQYYPSALERHGSLKT